MRKGLLFFLATFVTIALALVSCTNDENLDVSEGGAIEFRTLVEKSDGLRAAITKEESILGFTVTGIKTNDAGTQVTSSPYLFNGFSIARGEDENNLWNYTPKRFWPVEGAVNFYAYSPASSKNVTSGLLDFSIATGGRKTITYNVPKISITEAQEDFLVARTSKKKTSPVTLRFHHALSRVMLFARTSQTKVTYTIDKIVLRNLYSQGELDLTSTLIPETGNLNYASTLQPWFAKGSRTDYMADMSKSPVYMLNGYTPVLGNTNAIMVLPQATTLKTSDEKTAPTTEFAIEVHYKAFVDDIYYAGSKDVSAVKYFAVKAPTTTNTPLTFEMGRQYNFMLTFGDDVGDIIDFEVSLSDWNNEPVIPLPVISDYKDLISPDLKLAAGFSLTQSINYTQLFAKKDITITGINPTGCPNIRGIEYFPALKTINFGTSTLHASYDSVDLSKCPILTDVVIRTDDPKSYINKIKLPASIVSCTSACKKIYKADGTVGTPSGYHAPVFSPTFNYSPYLSTYLKGIAVLSGTINKAALDGKTSLTISGSASTGSPDLQGIECFTKLKTVYLNGTYNLVDLSGCTALESIVLEGGDIKTIYAPYGITGVEVKGGKFGKMCNPSGRIIHDGTK